VDTDKDLNRKVQEYETCIQNLQRQNEELQFAFEKECDRRQFQEEERYKAEERSRYVC